MTSTSERTLRAIGRVGQGVNLAVERFVTVGETIADDNTDIKQDMYDACKEARAAGELFNWIIPFLQKTILSIFKLLIVYYYYFLYKP